ncbi:hypothetical protein WJX73_001761 [Symbiochloris irregularis]|uniref:Calmodulin n=1 Tax=Symbiochloris irregularis TaxID=706552 RepID=A0AAW1PAJ6_9CHLO
MRCLTSSWGHLAVLRPDISSKFKRHQSYRCPPARCQKSVDESLGSVSSRQSLGGAGIPEWRRTVDEDRALVQQWRELFHEADKDGNGVIDKQELVELLKTTNNGLQDQTLDFLAEMAIAKANNTTGAEEADHIHFKEYCVLMHDGLLVEGKLQEYLRAFEAVDTSGNGLIGANEIMDLFQKLGQPLKSEKLAKIMEDFDTDQNGQIDFSEFLNMFSDQLLDLQAMQEYLRMQPKPFDGEARPDKLIEPRLGQVNMFFGEDELNAILQEYGEKLVVVEASMTWCRPCKGFERPFEKFAKAYENAVFMKFFGNANENTKHIFTTRLKAPHTPSFYFLRKGTVIHSFTGANKEKLEGAMQTCLLPEENPVANANSFKMQVWRSNLGL